MRNRSIIGSVTFTLVAGLAAAGTPPSGFVAINNDYQTIREALVTDSTDGIANHALNIAALAAELAAHFDADRAGVAPVKRAACPGALSELSSAATTLAEPNAVAAARQAFGALSAPMVHYRDMVSSDRPEVVWCPMVKQR
jgi:hypothetical protein